MTVEKHITSISNTRKQTFLQTLLDLGFTIHVISSDDHTLHVFKDSKFLTLLHESPQFTINSGSTIKIAKNKHRTKDILLHAGFSCPRGILTNTSADILTTLEKNLLSYPLVIKPLNLSRGAAISMNITTEQEVLEAVNVIHSAQSHEVKFVAEEMVYGKDYRVLVLDDEVIACAERVPAHVIGDGTSSIQELVDIFNAQRPKHYHINIGDVEKEKISEKTYTLETVLQKDEYLQLRDNANVSSGGTVIDCTETISLAFKEIAISATASIGAKIAGVDIMTPDITISDTAGYHIIEINHNPDYDLHEDPIIPGAGNAVTKKIIEYLFKNYFK